MKFFSVNLMMAISLAAVGIFVITNLRERNR